LPVFFRDFGDDAPAVPGRDDLGDDAPGVPGRDGGLEPGCDAGADASPLGVVTPGTWALASAASLSCVESGAAG
jgi:hypothetical protein